MVDLDTLRSLLGWTALLNYALLTALFLLWVGLRRSLHAMHRRWFDIEPARIDAIVHGLMGGYKLANALLFVAPWLALHLMD